MKNQNLTATGRVVDHDSQLRNTALEQAQSLNPLLPGFDFSSIRPKGARLSSGAPLVPGQDLTFAPGFVERCHQMLCDAIYKGPSSPGPNGF